MTCDYTVVLNCPKQRGFILISDIQQEGCSKEAGPMVVGVLNPQFCCNLLKNKQIYHLKHMWKQ